MKFVKKGLLYCSISAVFSILWLFFLNFVDFKKYELITIVVFIVVSIGVSLISTRKYLARKDVNIIKRIGSIVLTAVASFVVMFGIFYLSIIGLLLFIGI